MATLLHRDAGVPRQCIGAELSALSASENTLQGLIYVVDSNDRHRVRKAAEELHKMVLDNEMRFAVLLVFANKVRSLLG